MGYNELSAGIDDVMILKAWFAKNEVSKIPGSSHGCLKHSTTGDTSEAVDTISAMYWQWDRPMENEDYPDCYALALEEGARIRRRYSFLKCMLRGV